MCIFENDEVKYLLNLLAMNDSYAVHPTPYADCTVCMMKFESWVESEKDSGIFRSISAILVAVSSIVSLLTKQTMKKSDHNL